MFYVDTKLEDISQLWKVSPGASSALSHSVGDSGTVSLTLAPTHPGMGSWMRGERAQESVCVCLHISFRSELHRVKRGLAKQAEVKGQEAPGEEVKGQRPPRALILSWP